MKASPSATEVAPLPPAEEPVSEPVEAQVEAPVVEEPAPPVQEEEKPDFTAQLKSLPDEERERVLNDVYAERLQRMEQAAQDRAYARLQADQARQQKNNANLQDTLRNLDAETDDNRRMQHIASFAQTYAQEYATQQSQTWRTYFDDAYKRTFGLTQGEYEATWIDVHKESRKQGREATDADFLAHMMGEKFMPKSQMNKEQREEMAAMVEEAVGKRLAGQPSPVTLGPGESSNRKEYTRSQLAAMSHAEYAAQEEDIKEAMWAGRIKDE